MIAIIDIGSNTIRLSAYKVGVGGEISQIHKLRNVVGLARYIDDKNILSADGIAEACAALRGFRTALSGMEINETHVFATAPLRNIANTAEAVETIRRETGFDVNVLSGEEEALCGYTGVANDISMDYGVFIDIGGGSTEIVIGNGGTAASKASLPVGSLNMYTKHVTKVLPTKAQSEKIRMEAIAKIEASGINPSGETIPAMYGVGGAVRTLCALNSAAIRTGTRAQQGGNTASASDVKRILELIELDTQYMLGKITRIAPERVLTITPGLIILDAAMDVFGCKTITVSESGVREGYLIRNVLKRGVSIPPSQNARLHLYPYPSGSNA